MVARERDWTTSPAMDLLRAMFDDAMGSIEANLKIFSSLESKFETLTVSGDPNSKTPYWENGWFPPLDAISLCGFLAKTKPKQYIEVGSGNSTKYARWIIDGLGLNTQIISIDPQPRAEVDSICDEVIRFPLENVPTYFFNTLDSNDLIFVDNSHYAFQNSDVTVFFTEILPILPPGTLVGIHDIFLPYDYPQAWVARKYNEQYLLAAYLFGGAGNSSIEFTSHYLLRNFPEQLKSFFPKLTANNIQLDQGGAFWMQKR